MSDDPKRIERSQLGQTKFGSRADGTESAHRFSWRLLNIFEGNTQGRPLGGDSKTELTREMNADANLHIKTGPGNDLDDENDVIIGDAFLEGKPLTTLAVIDRALQALRGARTLSNPKYAKILEEMWCQLDGERPHKLKNH